MYTHSELLLSHKKEILSLTKTSMSLEGIRLSETSQAEKDKRCCWEGELVRMYNLTYMWNLKTSRSKKQRVERHFPGVKREGDREVLVKEHTVSAVRRVTPGDLRCRKATKVNTVLCAAKML